MKVQNKSSLYTHTHTTMKPFYDMTSTITEIGVDESGRGPLFGRVYTAAVVLPRSLDTLDLSLIKDSKKFHSTKKIKMVSDYIKQHATAWSISYSDESYIDNTNISHATLESMKCSIVGVINHYEKKPSDKFHLLIDGNYFKPLICLHDNVNSISTYNHTCIPNGDDTYSSIAAASILAKVARDDYIVDMCSQYPCLDEHYGLLSNKGYGTKKHIDGIKTHGITEWHRKTFKPCNLYIKTI